MTENCIKRGANEEKQCRSTVEEEKKFCIQKIKDFSTKKHQKNIEQKEFFSWEMFSLRKTEKPSDKKLFSIALINGMNDYEIFYDQKVQTVSHSPRMLVS